MPGTMPTVVKLPRRTALRQTTLMDSIYLEIRGRLQRGEIGPDDRVLDYEVAKEFDCTRMPVRQALLRLVNEGYLSGTTRGFVIPVLTDNDVQEIFEVRRLLEPSAAASVVPLLTDAQLEAMRVAYQQTRDAYNEHDTELMIEGNVAFRSVWINMVQNHRLKASILRFADHVRQVRMSTIANRPTQKIVVDGLKELLDGFVARDPARIHQAMFDFTLSAEQQYFGLHRAGD